MTTNSPAAILEALRQNPLVAVVRLPNLDAALPLTRALAAGGVGAIEFTLTSRGAYQAIESVVSEMRGGGGVLVGAGTVTTADEARAAISSGAQFIVSPVTDSETIRTCVEAGIACMPGAFTPTEILAAWRLGASVVKIFPAGVLGPCYLKDVRAPLPDLRLMPTGGIHLENIGDFIRSGAFAIGVGSSLVDPRQVANGNWEALTRTAGAYARAILEARG